MHAKIHFPDGHHSWAIDLFELDKDTAAQFRRTIREVTLYPIDSLEDMELSNLKAARPYIQGDQAGWMRIEFWSGDEDILLNAMIYLCKPFNIPLEI